jgi:bifunctional non-homologous end joining protein LigD
LKLDGFRAVAFKSSGRVHLRSRNNKDFNRKYPLIVQALAMPDETVIDGEVVALDDSDRPSFSALRNYTSGAAPIVYYVFDAMVLQGQDVMAEPLTIRRGLLQSQVMPNLAEPDPRVSELDASLPDLIATVKAHGLEGMVAKRRDSRYERGQRSGVWLKMRVNRGQEFVIGGYTIGPNGLDALVFGYYADDQQPDPVGFDSEHPPSAVPDLAQPRADRDSLIVHRCVIQLTNPDKQLLCAYYAPSLS